MNQSGFFKNNHTISDSRLHAWIILTLILTVNIVFNIRELTERTYALNDLVLHYGLVQRAVQAVLNLENPLDHWNSCWTMGYPMFHYYQFFPHLVSALLYLLLDPPVSLLFFVHFLNIFLLLLFPFVIYHSVRLLEGQRLFASCAALVSFLLSSDSMYGLDASSYLWGGYGLYSQLWAMLVLPYALVYSWRCLEYGRWYGTGAMLLALTFLCHMILGYIGFFSILLMVFAGGVSAGRGIRLRRCMLLGGGALLILSFFLVPFILNSRYILHSIWEFQWKWDSFGAWKVLADLVKGDLFDFGKIKIFSLQINRFPLITFSLSVGMIIVFMQKNKIMTFWGISFIFWTLYFWGRPAWGNLMDLIPLAKNLHLHRMICGVHLFGIYVSGAGLYWFLLFLSRKFSYKWVLLAAAVLIFTPVLQRIQYFTTNEEYIKTNVKYFESDTDYLRIKKTLDKVRFTGRVYPGKGANWGKDFKVGYIPYYAILSQQGFDALSYLYHAMSINADVQVHFDEQNLSQYELFNVQYVIAPKDLPLPYFAKPVKNFNNACLYEVETSGYFKLCDVEGALRLNQEQLYRFNVNWLGSEFLKNSRFFRIYLDEDIPESEKYPVFKELPQFTRLENFKPLTGTLKNFKRTNERYKIDVDANRDSDMVFKMTYHPGWKAKLDGKETEVFMVTPGFMAIKVPAGTHHVSFWYRGSIIKTILFPLFFLIPLLLHIFEKKGGDTYIANLKYSNYLKRISIPVFFTNIYENYLLKIKKEKLFAFLILFMLSLVIGLPFLKGKLISGHDSLEYPPRIVEFHENVKHLTLFPRWAPDLNGGYGEPFFIFNPPLFYYLAEIFVLAGFTFISATGLASFAIILFSSLFIYLASTELFGTKGGIISAFAYLTSPYFLVNFYVRNAFAEASAFMIFPIVIYAALKFFKTSHFLYCILLTISVMLIFLTHNPMSLIFIPLVFVFLTAYVIYYRDRKAIHAIIAFASGVLCASWFFYPALKLTHLVKLNLLLEDYFNYKNHFVFPEQLISSKWGYGLSFPGREDGMSFSLGTEHLLLAIFSIFIFFKCKIDKINRLQVILFSLFGLFTIFLATGYSGFIWSRVTRLQYFEFPWRMLAPGVFFIALVSGGAALKIRSSKFFWLILFLLCALCFGRAKPEKYLETTDNDFSPSEIREKKIAVTTRREYSPIWFIELPEHVPKNKLEIVKGSGAVLHEEISPDRYDFKVDLSADSHLQIHTTFFPGWEVSMDGKSLASGHEGDQRAIVFDAPAGIHEITVTYRRTSDEKIALLLTAAGLIAGLANAIIYSKRKL